MTNSVCRIPYDRPFINSNNPNITTKSTYNTEKEYCHLLKITGTSSKNYARLHVPYYRPFIISNTYNITTKTTYSTEK